MGVNIFKMCRSVSSELLLLNFNTIINDVVHYPQLAEPISLIEVTKPPVAGFKGAGLT